MFRTLLGALILGVVWTPATWGDISTATQKKLQATQPSNCDWLKHLGNETRGRNVEPPEETIANFVEHRLDNCTGTGPDDQFLDPGLALNAVRILKDIEREAMLKAEAANQMITEEKRDTLKPSGHNQEDKKVNGGNKEIHTAKDQVIETLENDIKEAGHIANQARMLSMKIERNYIQVNIGGSQF
jgi:hypothetical protein